jgi:chromosome segregation ATPase
MAQSDVFDILLNLDLSKDGAEKQAKAAVKELSSIFEKVTEIKPNLSTDGVKLNLKELQTLFRNFGATVDGVFDFSGATKQLEQLIVNLKTAQGEMSKTTISFGGADKEGNIQTSISSTRVTSLKEQEKDIQNIVNLVLKEDEAWQKVQESQKTGNAIIQDYYNSVLNATTKEREFAEANFEKKYGDLNQVPALWQEIEDRINRVNNLEQENKKIAATEEYKKRANEVKEFKEALDALVQSQQKMGALLGSGKGDTEEFSVALAQWTAAKNVLEGFGATVTDTGVKITKNSEIVKQNQTAFEGLDKATKEASVDMIAAYAKLGDTANLEIQKRAVNDFEKALNKLVSTRQKMYQLEGQGKTDTNEYKVLAQQYDEAKQKLEGYGATVTDTSVKIEKDSLIVNNNAETYDKLSNKLDDVNDKLPLYKAKAEDAGEASKGAEEKQNSFSQSIQSSVENFIKYQVAMEAINKITSEFTSAIYDMNEAMTQVRMVTMGSYEDTVALADSYTKLAKQLGTTTTTVAEGADAWLKCLGQVKSL